MTWLDRLRPSAYTSPSGVRTSFLYEDVSKEIDKRGSAWEFPDVNGTYIQGMGHSGRRFPLRVIFSGPDYDTTADEFEASLLESGDGVLEHPRYGVFKAVPFGKIKFRDDLKTASNQTIIEITFWETTGIVYPSAQTDPASEILLSIDEFNGAIGEEFEENLALDTAVETEAFKGENQSLLDNVSDGLQSLADVNDAVAKQFKAIDDSINNSIDILIGQPLALAAQTTQLIQAPARAAAGITDRLEAYGNLTNSIIGSLFGTSNSFRNNDLFASAYVTGSVLSTVNNQFDTRGDALAAADVILSQFEAVTDWRDSNFELLGLVDTGDSFTQLQNSVALVAGFLVEISFDLRQEKTLVLDRARTIIDLVGELYGSVDDQLDFFINSNNLTGSEILELPRGKTIVYYV